MTTDYYQCGTCGAAVTDREKHDAWHREQERRGPVAVARLMTALKYGDRYLVQENTRAWVLQEPADSAGASPETLLALHQAADNIGDEA